MDRKSLAVIIVIIGGGMMLSQYSDVFHDDKPGRSPSRTENSPPVLRSAGEVSLPGKEDRSSFAEVVKMIEPSLINISAVHIIEVKSPFYRFYFGDPFEDFFDDFFGRRPRRERPEPETHRRRQEGTGSGFIVGSEGYVLTNYHVIREAEELKVTTYDGETYDAELIGQDPRTDLAVIRIKSRRRFNAIKLGDSDEVEIGDWVMAAGSPFGLNQTFTAGIISAVRQDVQVERVQYRNMIQTDAAINRGNSGGPLVNLSGEVVGINTAIFAPTGVFAGIGFAIPVNDAKQVLGELIEKGRVVRGWLGVEISDVDAAIRRQFGLETEKGVLVNSVMEDSAALDAGLRRGDVIVEIDGDEVENTRELQHRVSSASPGQEITIGIIRNGEKLSLEATLGEMPEETPVLSRRETPEEVDEEEETSEWLGITVSNITRSIKERYGIEEEEGVVVTDIDPAGDGYGIGLRVGDVIKELNRQRTTDIAGFRSAAEEASIEDGVVFDVVRGGRPLFISFQSSR